MKKQAAAQETTPKKWGIFAGAGWAMIAFLAPQFALYPLAPLIGALATDDNARAFLFQGIAELGAITLLWFIMKRLYNAKFSDIGLGPFDVTLFGWSILAFPLYMIASIIATDVAARLFSVDLDQAQDIGYSDPSEGVLVLVFIALVCLAPFVEEILFRGFLFNAFRRTFGFWVGSIAVSLLFAVAHQQVNVGIDVFVLSMFLCFLREKTSSLWPTIGLHALKNLVAFTYLFIIHVK